VGKTPNIVRASEGCLGRGRLLCIIVGKESLASFFNLTYLLFAPLPHPMIQTALSWIDEFHRIIEVGSCHFTTASEL
jgi:hypothetical protein